MKNFQGSALAAGVGTPESVPHELLKSSLHFYLGYKHRDSSCNPVNYIDPYGLTYYRVGGEVFDIDDGFDDEIEVTKSEYRRLKNRFKYSDSL